MAKTMTIPQCEALYDKANDAGLAAAKEVELPQFLITETNAFGEQKENAKQYIMNGLCGFAWVSIKPANMKFAKWMVQNAGARKDSYAGGVRFPIFGFEQSIDKKAAYAGAFAGVLQDAGMKKVYMDSRLD